MVSVGRHGFRWSIAPVLTLSMVLVIGLLTVSTTVVDILRERSIFRNKLENDGLLLVNSLNDVLANPLYYSDMDQLRDIAEVATRRPDVTSIRVFRPDGRLLVDSPRGKGQYEYPTGFIQSELAVNSLQAKEATIQTENGLLSIATPIIAGKELLGGIVLEFHTEALDREIQGIIWQHVFQGLTTMVIGIALSWLLAQYFARPLKKLVSAAQSVGQGEFAFPAGKQRQDEIGDLACALEDMTNRLKAGTTELRDTNERLSAEVSERKEAEQQIKASLQ